MPEQKGIYKAILDVMLGIGAISKDQQNSAQKYKFRGIDDLYNALHKPLAEAGVFIVPEILDCHVEHLESKSGTPQIHFYGRYKFTAFSSDGSSISGVTAGQSIDTSDKAANKAHAAALKYFLLTLLLIPTEDMEDADKYSPEGGRVIPNSGIGKLAYNLANQKKPVEEKGSGIDPRAMLKTTILKFGDGADEIKKFVLGRCKVDDLELIPDDKLSSIIDYLDRQLDARKAKRQDPE